MRGEGRDPILLKSGRGGAHSKLVAANLGDDLVVRHGDHVDHHGECTQVAALAVGRRVVRFRVGTEGRQKAEKGHHAGGVQEGQCDAYNEDTTLRDRPVDERRCHFFSFTVLSVGLGVGLKSEVVIDGTRGGLLVGRALIHFLGETGFRKLKPKTLPTRGSCFLMVHTLVILHALRATKTTRVRARGPRPRTARA